MIFNENEAEEEHVITRQYLSGNIGLKSQYMRVTNEINKNITLILSSACQYRANLKREHILDYSIVNRSNAGNINALNCFEFYYNYFSDYCDSVEQLVMMRDIVLDMKVIHISSENELDCYDIFEILNARGVELEESELLKNYIFKYAQPEYTVDRAKDIWSKIEYNISACKGNLDLFLSNFVTYRYGKPSKDENVF